MPTQDVDLLMGDTRGGGVLLTSGLVQPTWMVMEATHSA